MKNILNSSISQVHKHLVDKSITSCEVLDLCLRRAKYIKPLNAFVCLDEKHSPKQAEKSKQRYMNRTAKGSLDGIPIAVKDNFCVTDVPTTCGSKMLADFVPPYSATVVQKLLDAGAVCLGKTNLDEFGMGSGTVDSIHGPTYNVWGSSLHHKEQKNEKTQSQANNNLRISGGSSGGSAVAVASGACFAALGSDTGGSTRNPAAYCGIVGFKPTYSTVSRHGLIPLVNSMDVPGILTKRVQDAALVYNCIRGQDDKDSTTTEDGPNINLNEPLDLSRLRVGIPMEYHCQGMSQEVLDVWALVADTLQKSGALLTQVFMPHTKYSIACYSVLNVCEVASNMARYDGLRYGHRGSDTSSLSQLYAQTRSEGFNIAVRSRILTGNYFLLQRNYQKYFEKALKIRRLISDDFKKAWNDVDVLLTPTTLSEAPTYEEFIQFDNRKQCSVQDYCTQPANMSGCPAITIPIQLSKNGLPLSIQLMAPNFQDHLLLKVANFIENSVQFPYLQLNEL